MLTKEQILSTVIVPLPPEFAQNAEGVYAAVAEYAAQPFIVFSLSSIDKEFARLFQASPVLYKALQNQRDAMKRMEDYLASKQLHDIAAQFNELVAALDIAMSVATEGVDHASRQLDARNILKNFEAKGNA